MEFSDYDNEKHNKMGEKLCSNSDINLNSTGYGYTYITIDDILEYTKKPKELISTINPFNIDKKIKFKYYGEEILDKNGDKRRISFIADDWNMFRPIMFLLLK